MIPKCYEKRNILYNIRYGSAVNKTVMSNSAFFKFFFIKLYKVALVP